MTTEQTKTCTKCGETKPLSEFYQKNDGKLGRHPSCISCFKSPAVKAARAAYMRAYRQTESGLAKMVEARSTDEYKEYMAAYEASPERKAKKKIYTAQPERKEWQATYDKSESRVAARLVYEATPGRRDMQSAAAAKRNAHPETKAAHAARMRALRKTPKGKIECSIRAGVTAEIKRGSKGGRRTFDLLGYTVEDLKSHLEALFVDGMSWENYGRFVWHIDHIRPLASFNYETPDDPEFKEAWALSNLQPLWARDNLSKGSKWEPEQEAA